MSLKYLVGTPPWEWPQNAAEEFRGVLSDPQADRDEREIAADLAGDYTVISDDLAELLLGIIANAGEDEEIRAKSAISLGPALQAADEALDWEDDDVPITEPMYRQIQQTLEKTFRDEATPKSVRRRVLEASVRSAEDWHQDAIRTAYDNGDRDWRLTAVFAMRFIRGFDPEILAMLDSSDPEIRYEAVVAAGEAGLKTAWPQIRKLVQDRKTPKELRLAAIEAAGGIAAEDASDVLMPLADSKDEEIAEAADDALSMAEGAREYDDEEDLESDEEEDEEV